MFADPSGRAWYDVLYNWGNTVAGLLNLPSKVIAAGAIITAMSQRRWSDLQHDWNIGCFNPFNQSESVALNSKVFSFYKGESVVRHSIPNSSSLQIFGTIFLNSNEYNTNAIKHEWGHGVQERFLSVLYLQNIAIPSVIYYWFGSNKDIDYYSTPWERTADWLGGVNRSSGYKKGSLAWAIAENLLGPIVIAFYLLWGY